jgi:hypothetical protein
LEIGTSSEKELMIVRILILPRDDTTEAPRIDNAYKGMVGIMAKVTRQDCLTKLLAIENDPTAVRVQKLAMRGGGVTTKMKACLCNRSML